MITFASKPGPNQIFDHFVLRIDGDAFAGEFLEIEVVPVSVETQVHAVVKQAFAIHALAQSRAPHEIHGALLKHSGPHPAFNVRPALGFTRRYAPHATTLTRVTALYSLAEFQDALCRWLAGLLAQEPPRTAAVDGKTSKQGHDADGDPIHVLNVFAHKARICLAQWAVGDGKETEPEVLKAHLGELFAAYPALQLLTGDALFCQRPLARLIVEAGRDYLFAVKDNQPDLHETAQTAFADATPETADAGTREKKGVRW